MARIRGEGLQAARLMMVISSLAPLFALWATRGIKLIPDRYFVGACLLMIIVPNCFLYLKIKIARRENVKIVLTVGQAKDQREHLVVYLLGTLMPLYDANLGSGRDFAATLLALVFIIFLFWHLDLHYMNIAFALFGYRIFVIQPRASDSLGRRDNFILLTKRVGLKPEDQITSIRVTNTVFFEPEDLS